VCRVTDTVASTVCACSRRHTRGHARFGELWFDVVRFVFVPVTKNVFSFNDSEVRVFVWDTDYSRLLCRVDCREVPLLRVLSLM